MYEYLSSPGNLMNLLVALIALVFGASAHTVRNLKSSDVSVKGSLVEWAHNQASAVPIGLMAILTVPEHYPSIKGPELLALMLLIGIFSTELWAILRKRVLKTLDEEDYKKSAEENKSKDEPPSK